MKMSSVHIKDMIESEASLGWVFKQNLFIGRQPSSPNVCVTIYDTPGQEPSMAFDRSTYEKPSVQIKVRGTDYDRTSLDISAIASLLQGRAHEVMEDVYYSGIKISSGPFFLSWDENNRANFVVNLNIQRRKL